MHCGARQHWFGILLGGLNPLIGGGALLDARTHNSCTPLMVAQQYHPASAELHALLSGRGPAQAPGMTCDQCGVLEDPDSRLKSCGLYNAARYCGAAWRARRRRGVCTRRPAASWGGSSEGKNARQHHLSCSQNNPVR
jgi:hypothetical protein